MLHSEVKILFVVLYSPAFFFSFLQLRRALRVVAFLCTWQKQSVWGHCESRGKTSKLCSPPIYFVGLFYVKSRDEHCLRNATFITLSCSVSDAWQVSWCSWRVWNITVNIHTESVDSRHRNAAAKFFDFWRAGFTRQQLIYDCQTSLAMTSARE